MDAVLALSVKTMVTNGAEQSVTRAGRENAVVPALAASMSAGAF